MSQLLFIEIFVLGASLIAAIYHFVLFVQQKDRFLLFYSIYLFAASAYLVFKLFSDNYDPFSPSGNVIYYTIEEVLQVIMYSSYATFAAVTLEVTRRPVVIKWCWIGLLIFSGVTIIIHVSKALILGPGVTTRTAYAVSRLSTIAVAGFALALAWRVRTSVFQKTIIIGSCVYAFFAMLSVCSFVFGQQFIGLSGVEPYMVGSFIDIIIFSAALGYRFKKIADEKNRLLRLSLKTSESRSDIANTLNSNVGAALSSMHLYASVAGKVIHSQPEKARSYMEQINTSSLQLMDEVGDLVWALHLQGPGIAGALQNRIKTSFLELLGSGDIHCYYRFNVDAMDAIHDAGLAKSILSFVKNALRLLAAGPWIAEAKISFFKKPGHVIVKVNEHSKTFPCPDP